MKPCSFRSRFLSSLFLATLLLAAVPVSPAVAGDCDGTPSDDDIICSLNPTVPDTEIDLEDGNDTLVVNTGVATGSVDAGLGNDHITIDGTVSIGLTPSVYGEGGNDTIIVNGTVVHIVVGDAGNDTIIINGHTSAANGNDGADVITINGSVTTGAFGGDDNDSININGTVSGNVEGGDGNDSVALGRNASIGGQIDGGVGTDTLSFKALTQAQVNALNPAGGSVTVNGNIYTWLNFEKLLGLLEELAKRGVRVFLASDTLLAIESNDGNGISFFAAHGRIAFVSFESLDSLTVGEINTYSTPNSAGWYVILTNLGVDPNNARHDRYQVTIFNPGGTSIGQFTFSN